MGREIYPALSGGIQALRSLDVLANNLANAETPGFKADRPVFALVAPPSRGPLGGDEAKLARSYTTLAGNAIDFTEGALVESGSPTDLAIDGPDGFFALESSAGTLLTRDGSFVVDEAGFLASRSGGRVLSDSGAPIAVGPGFAVDPAGYVSQGDEVTARIGVVRVADRSALEKVGGNTFRTTQPTEASAAAVRQGYTETSNVEPARALVELVALTRYYEAFERGLETSSRLDQKLADDVARIR